MQLWSSFDRLNKPGSEICFKLKLRKTARNIFVNYQSSSGLKGPISHFGLDLIRSISANHRVAVEHSGMQSMVLQDFTPTSPLLNTKTHADDYFQAFSYTEAHIAYIMLSPYRYTVPLKTFQSSKTLTFDFGLTLGVFYGNEGGRGNKKSASLVPHKTFSLVWHILCHWPVEIAC